MKRIAKVPKTSVFGYWRTSRFTYVFRHNPYATFNIDSTLFAYLAVFCSSDLRLILVISGFLHCTFIAMTVLVYPDVFYGTLTSLYQTLDVPTLLQLEKAIVHRNLRNFFESLAIFDSFTDSVVIEPVVCLEHTWTLIAQYRFREAHTIATRGLSARRKSAARNENHGVAIVLRALLAGLDALVERSTHRCFESLEEIHEWLKHIVVEDLTDVQVSFPSGHLP